MGSRTLLYFLIGSRTAIRQVAASEQALWLGLVFVLSAGLAREYDGQDLVHEPWHLLIPQGHRWLLLSCFSCSVLPS
jgi:hypothetical protein